MIDLHSCIDLRCVAEGTRRLAADALYDPVSLERRPVRKHDVLTVFADFQNQEALAAVRAIPERDGFLDPRAVDQLLLTVHWEMQRLAEEFFHGHRVRQLLESAIAALRAQGFKGPLRVVDVGSGIGYAIRWLAARTSLPARGVELIGMDLNSENDSFVYSWTTAIA